MVAHNAIKIKNSMTHLHPNNVLFSTIQNETGLKNVGRSYLNSDLMNYPNKILINTVIKLILLGNGQVKPQKLYCLPLTVPFIPKNPHFHFFFSPLLIFLFE